jgi:hypothetical protein
VSTKSQQDFWRTLVNLRAIAKRLGAVPAGSEGSRSENQIILNGLHVVAFAALEDFVRRRTHEVISWLGIQDIHFDQFPVALQMLILEGTIEGVAFSLSRIDRKDKVTLLQLQGLLIGEAGEKGKFTPSEFFFGRSSSNLSKGSLTTFLGAMGIDGSSTCLSSLAEVVGMRHLGSVEEVFTRLSKNRHSAAHAFSDEYKLTEYQTDISAALPFFAFAFDTAISQCAASIRKSVVEEGLVYDGFSVDGIFIRVLEFDAQEKVWIERRGNKIVSNLSKGEVGKRLEKFRKGELGRGDTILKMGLHGAIDEWIQPLIS